MTDTTGPPARSALFGLSLLWLVGAQLRLTILAVPPILPLIHRELGLSEKAIGVLSGLPVLLLGLAAIPGSLTIARLGARRACILALVIVAGAGAARGIGPSAAVLFGMTLAMGAGVALLQPAMASLVGEWFPYRTGFATAVYGNGLLIGEAAPAALTIPLVLPWVGGSWGWSLAVWSLPVAATALLVTTTTRHRRRTQPAGSYRWLPDWHSLLLWQLGLVLGGTSGLYFSANSFLPDYLHAIGRPELVSAGLSALNIGQLPASALILAFAGPMTRSRVLLIGSLVLALAGLAVMLIPTPTAIVAGAALVGFCGAFQLILVLALPPLLAPADDIHRLSAGMFAIGYGMSFFMQPLGGAVWDATGIPATAFSAAAMSVVLALAAAASLPRLAPARTAPAASARHR